MIEFLFAQLTVDVKGAIAGGVVACILDRGTFYRRLFNGIGSIVISMTCTRGILDIAGGLVPKTDSVVMLFASIFAILGIVAAEILQRVARRFLGRADDVTDKVIDRYTGAKHVE